MRKSLPFLFWLALALVGAGAFSVIATRRAEPLNSGYLLIAALCTYALGYRFYSKWIAARVLMLDDRRATPATAHPDGRDFVPTNPWIVFGHHFAAISGPGPLVGPVLAAQFGYLPGTLWILIGVVLGGAVQDFLILFASLRRDGQSLAEMLHRELSRATGWVGLVAILAIMTVLLAVLALVVVNGLAESPWGVFTVGATIPIALLMGGYLRFVRVGKVLEVSAMGALLLLAAVWGGRAVYEHEAWSRAFTFSPGMLAGVIIAYGLAASVLPVWLLLAPRDYLSTFMKLGTIFALIVGVCVVRPDLAMPAFSRFAADGSGLVVPGKIFPFCFITIACGAISGFHTLIASGTTPKMIARERDARAIGYGAMLLESLVAIVALIAACTLSPDVYLPMNVKGAGPTPAAIAADIKAKVDATGFLEYRPGVAGAVPVEVSLAGMDRLAGEMGEHSLYGRTGGAATLAVGMAAIFTHLTSGRGLALWYHFALMFEALFILTTLDAGTRVGRYLVQGALGHLWKPLGETKSVPAAFLASALVVLGWGAFLIMGVRDPAGGITALWPIFGIANQLLAAIALCLAATMLLKMALRRTERGRLALVLVALVPLLWLLAVTFTAGAIKVTSADPRFGFLAAARVQEARLPALETQAATGAPAALLALQNARTQRFNGRVDAAVTAGFMTLAALVVILTAWEWLRLLRGSGPPELHEAEPVWIEAEPPGLGFGFLRELSGEADFAREHQQARTPRSRRNVYLSVTERRFTGVRRCC